MKRRLFALLFILRIAQSLIAQPVQYAGGSKIYDKAEKQPEFPGGAEAFKAFSQSPVDRFRDYNCSVELSFVVEKNGSLNKIKALTSYDGDGCVTEAIKILKSSPKWIPGSIAGKPVRVRLTVHVELNHAAPSFTDLRPPAKNFVYTSVEEMPQFIGGMDAFQNYLRNNLNYPPTAIKNGTQGKVIVSFIVERNSKLTQLKVSRGIGAGVTRKP